MATRPTEERLSLVEQALRDLAHAQARTDAQLARTDAQLARTDAQLARTDAQFARSDRRWGEMANKMGTLTEDIVLPGVPDIFRAFFGGDGDVDMAVRVRRRHPADPGRSEEYDAIVAGGDVLLIAESKSRLRPEHLGEFVAKLARARELLPEAAGKRIVGLLGSFLLDASLVTAGERQGLIMAGLGSGLLQVLNRPGFVPGDF